MSTLLLLLLLPLMVLGQSSSTSGSVSAAPSGSANASASLTTITSTVLSTSVGLGPNRQQTTAIISSVTTIVQPIPTGNTTSGNSTNTNSTTSSSTTVTPKNLPTAPANVDGGGQGGAPKPGASSPNGIYGPDDNYIAAATALARNALGVSLVVSAVGVLLLF